MAPIIVILLIADPLLLTTGSVATIHRVKAEAKYSGKDAK